MYPLHPNEERIVNSAKQAQKYFEFLNSRPQKKYESWDEYNSDLDSWFQQTYHVWNLTAKFPYFLAKKQIALRQRFPASNTPQQPPSSASTREAPVPPPQDDLEGIECLIPPVWKRLAAEVIDFVILFFFKVASTFVAIDFYDFFDLDILSLADDLFQGDSKLEYKAVLQITHNFLLLELVHRLVVCAFETYWLIGSDDRIGGATPGKAAMGLCVIRCHSVTELPPAPGTPPSSQRRLLVRPGGPLGFMGSLLRAMVKNAVLTFFIPASLALFYYSHNRTGYDILCNTIVVEEPVVRRRRNAEPAQ